MDNNRNLIYKSAVVINRKINFYNPVKNLQLILYINCKYTFTFKDSLDLPGNAFADSLHLPGNAFAHFLLIHSEFTSPMKNVD